MKIRANYSLPAELVEALRKASEDTGIKQSTIVENAIRKELATLESYLSK